MRFFLKKLREKSTLSPFVIFEPELKIEKFLVKEEVAEQKSAGFEIVV